MSVYANQNELAILNETYNFYSVRLGDLPEEEYSLVEEEFEGARKAIAERDVKRAVRYLTTLFEVADENDMLDVEEAIIYPGPGEFQSLTRYLD